jgi:hypothetical protein
MLPFVSPIGSTADHLLLTKVLLNGYVYKSTQKEYVNINIYEYNSITLFGDVETVIVIG